jgi:hypothetical protein
MSVVDNDQGLEFVGSGVSGLSSRGSSHGSGSSDAPTSASRTASGSAASNHSPTANNLNSRRIYAVETEYSKCFDTANKCRATSNAFFDLLCPGARGLSCESSPFYRSLLEAFDNAYSSENTFNEELFKIVGKCIRDLATERNRMFKFRSPVVCTNTLIVLEPKTPLVIGGMEYAIGLVREKALPKDRRSILARDARLDQAAVVLRRPANATLNRGVSWEVWVALSIVDFKKQGKGVRALAKNLAGNVDPGALRPLEARLHGPLAQVMMYTAAHAAKGTAALGQLPERIPFAVVSCKIAGGSNAEEESNWVHGNLVVPEVCGFPYAFNVDAYGTLVAGANQENHASLAAYLHVMAHGIELASNWLTKASQAHPPLLKTPAPYWMSGRTLHFGTGKPLTRNGENEAPLVLVATPVSKYGKSGLRIAQGELFKATVNLQALRTSVSGPEKVFWCCDTYATKEVSVLVKVSSRSCFNLLVPPESAYLYGLVERLWNADDDIRQVLSESLYGVYTTPGKSGLVQLLPNLVQQRYRVLRPEHWLFEDTWSTMWDAFAALVTGTLLPLAKYDILHADLRAGYDVTSNVLYNPTSGSMRMIDLDSLCDFDSLTGLTFTRDKRNFAPDDLPPHLQKTALAFLLGQVMCVSQAWLGGIRDADVNAARITAEPAKLIDDVKGAAEVDEALIAKVLAHYRRAMAEMFGSRRRPLLRAAPPDATAAAH